MGKITIREKIGYQIVKAMGDTYSANDATNYILRVLRSEIAGRKQKGKLRVWEPKWHRKGYNQALQDVLTLLQ